MIRFKFQLNIVVWCARVLDQLNERHWRNASYLYTRGEASISHRSDPAHL